VEEGAGKILQLKWKVEVHWWGIQKREKKAVSNKGEANPTILKNGAEGCQVRKESRRGNERKMSPVKKLDHSKKREKS